MQLKSSLWNYFFLEFSTLSLQIKNLQNIPQPRKNPSPLFDVSLIATWSWATLQTRANTLFRRYEIGIFITFFRYCYNCEYFSLSVFRVESNRQQVGCLNFSGSQLNLSHFDPNNLNPEFHAILRIKLEFVYSGKSCYSLFVEQVFKRDKPIRKYMETRTI